MRLPAFRCILFSATALLALPVYCEEPKPLEIGAERWRQSQGALNDQELEHVARGVGYSGGQTREEIMSDNALRTHLQNNGLKVVDAIGGGKKDMQAMLLEDTKTQQRYVVFRGSESVNDWKSDSGGAFSKEGVGRSQWEENKKDIADWFDPKKNPQNRNVIVTAHSLGGTHAQRLAVEFPSQIRRVAVFNSPGIEADRVAGSVGKNIPPINYYRNPNDPFAAAGKHVRGQVYNVTGEPMKTFSKGGIWGAEHRKAMLQGDKGIKIEETSFDLWQRGTKASPEETKFRIDFHKQSDRLLHEMNALTKKIDAATAPRDEAALKDLVKKYDTLNGELKSLCSNAQKHFPIDENDPARQDEQLRDVYGRRRQLEEFTMVGAVRASLQQAKPDADTDAAPETSGTSSNTTGNTNNENSAGQAGNVSGEPSATATAPAQQPSATTGTPNAETGAAPADPREIEVLAELTPPESDPTEESIVSQLQPAPGGARRSKKATKESKDDNQADLEALEEEAEADLAAQKAEKLMKQLEAEGFTEAQAAAFAANQAQIDSAQNMDDLLSAIGAALQDSGDWQPSGGGQKRSGSEGNGKPPRRKGVCDKPCGPPRKKR